MCSYVVSPLYGSNGKLRLNRQLPQWRLQKLQLWPGASTFCLKSLLNVPPVESFGLGSVSLGSEAGGSAVLAADPFSSLLWPSGSLVPFACQVKSDGRWEHPASGVLGRSRSATLPLSVTPPHCLWGSDLSTIWLSIPAKKALWREIKRTAYPRAECIFEVMTY